MIEDIGELPYRVDRMLNQLRLSGAFKKFKGIILAGLWIATNMIRRKKL